MVSSFCPFFRHRRIGEIYIYKTNEDHSWSGLLGRRQAWFHQVGLSKHLHGHAEHDPSDGSPEASVRGPHIRGKITNSHDPSYNDEVNVDALIYQVTR